MTEITVEVGSEGATDQGKVLLFHSAQPSGLSKYTSKKLRMEPQKTWHRE